MGTNQRSHGKSNLTSSSKKGSKVCLGGSILGFVTQGCLGTRKIKRRNSRTLHSQESTKHHERLLSHSFNRGLRPPSTLQEWIIQSPGIHYGSFEVDPLILQVSKPVSKRVHPSLDRSTVDRQFKPREGHKVKRNPPKLDYVKSGENDDSFTFSTAGKSGKLRKKVSFKEPEVADVFILKNSPE